MSKYTEPLLKLMILLMFWIAIMRIRYIWSISKVNDQETSFMFRNRDGDFSIFLFLIVIVNKSIFDRYKLAYQPILRYFYPIVVGMFIAYCLLQLSQFILVTKTGLVAQQGVISSLDINHYSMRKHLYGFKFNVNYTKKNKDKNLVFISSRKNKEIIEKRFKEMNINIV